MGIDACGAGFALLYFGRGLVASGQLIHLILIKTFPIKCKMIKRLLVTVSLQTSHPPPPWDMFPNGE